MKRSTHANFQQELRDMRQRLIRTVDLSEQALREDVHHPGELSNVPTHPADHDVEGLDREIAIAHNEEQLLAEVEAALERIEAGTFGTCEDCGKEISQQRLKAVPYARWCLKCAARHDHDAEDRG